MKHTPTFKRKLIDIFNISNFKFQKDLIIAQYNNGMAKRIKGDRWQVWVNYDFPAVVVISGGRLVSVWPSWGV